MEDPGSSSDTSESGFDKDCPSRTPKAVAASITEYLKGNKPESKDSKKKLRFSICYTAYISLNLIEAEMTKTKALWSFSLMRLAGFPSLLILSSTYWTSSFKE